MVGTGKDKIKEKDSADFIKTITLIKVVIGVINISNLCNHILNAKIVDCG